MRGQFIVIYGMNNLGKTTAATSLVEQLKRRGINIVYLKYPVYEIESGRQLNTYLREGNPEGLTAEQAQELFARNSRDHEAELLRTLDEGTTVVAEDYVGTGIAWGQIFGVSLKKLEEFNHDLLPPDITILLDGQRFSSGHEGNHKHESVSEKQWRFGRKVHLDLAQRYGWKIINANQAREEVLINLLDIVLLTLAPEGNRRGIEIR